MTARPVRRPAAPGSLLRRWRSLVAAVLLAVLGGGALAGCSGGDSSGSSGAAAGGVAQSDVGRDGAAGVAAPAQGAAGSGATGSGSSGRSGPSGNSGNSGASGTSGTSGSVAVAAPRLVMTASLRLQVDDVTRRAADVRTVAQGAGGSVTQEDLTGGTSTTSGTMTVQVPQSRLDGVLDQLAGLGTVLQRTTSSQDVTSTYVDTSSRVATMQASVARLRALLAGAKDLGQVVALEDELTKREADLESTQAQLADLQGRTTMATVSLSLSTPSPADRSTTASGSPGFLEGLRGGWHAFVAVVAWLLTALGAVLPFVALAAAVTLPVVAWRRRRTASEEATAAAGDPAVPEEEKRPTVTS